jgi:tetraacyldisaccharide 4'-kinase
VNTARPEARLQATRLQTSLKTARLEAATALWLHQQWQKRGLWARLLWPFSCLVRGYVWAKRVWYQSNTSRVYRAPVPVIIVGNLYVGGVGKTPVVIALVQQLLTLGYHPGVISRGYGVDVGPTPRVGQGKVEPHALGDEPSLISEQTHAPVCVHPNRRLACQALLAAHPQVDIIVSDDGLQHLALARDLEIIVQDQRQIGNGWLLPAGPLRESPSRLKAVDLVITRLATAPLHSAALTPSHLAEAKAEAEAKQQAPRSLNQATAARLVIKQPSELLMWLQVTRIHSLDNKINLSVEQFIKLQQNKATTAMAAISEPARFFKTLNDTGILYQHCLGLPDHHPLEVALFDAQAADLLLITSKDAVKCRARHDPRIWVVATEAVFSDAGWANKLAQHLPRHARSSSK